MKSLLSIVNTFFRKGPSVASNDPVFLLAGSGRSGTTWLGNIIAGDELVTYFEPFDYRRVPSFNGLGLRPYFRPDEPHEEWKDVVKKLLTGGLNDKALVNSNEQLDPCTCKGTLIKEIRVNGILLWLQKNFSLKFIFIIRNPCAVALSRLECNWVPEVDSFFENSNLISDFAIDVKPLKEKALNPLLAHVIMWCFENIVPLRHFGENLPVFKYEDIMSDKENVVPAILDTLDLCFNEARQNTFDQLSNMSTRRIIDRNELIFGWKNKISSDDLGQILYILEAFNLSSLYKLK